MTPSEALKRVERLGAVWHVGLAALYLFAIGFHAWAAYEHSRAGFTRDELDRSAPR